MRKREKKERKEGESGRARGTWKEEEEKKRKKIGEGREKGGEGGEGDRRERGREERKDEKKREGRGHKAGPASSFVPFCFSCSLFSGLVPLPFSPPQLFLFLLFSSSPYFRAPLALYTRAPPPFSLLFSRPRTCLFLQCPLLLAAWAPPIS